MRLLTFLYCAADVSFPVKWTIFKLAWPGLNYATAPGVLILLPSTPAIEPSLRHPDLAS